MGNVLATDLHAIVIGGSFIFDLAYAKFSMENECVLEFSE